MSITSETAVRLTLISRGVTSDGLFYFPLDLELDPQRDDLGHADRPDLPEIIDNDRPHTEGKLLCLFCYNHRRQIQWGYLRRDPRCPQLIFEHLNTTITSHYPPPAPESDKHKSLVEREIRVIEARGISVETEKNTKSGRARSDFRTFGGPVDLAGEVQVTRLTAGTIHKRTKIAFEDGLTPLWTTDIPNPDWIEKGPRAVIPSTTWQHIRAGTDLPVHGGARVVEVERCGRLAQRCPKTGSLTPCGQLHTYLQPARGLQLDTLVPGIATGEWRLLTETAGRRVHYSWLPKADLDRYLNDHPAAGLATLPPEAQLDLITNRIRRTHDQDPAMASYPSTAVIDMTAFGRTYLTRAGDLPKIHLDWRHNFTGPPRACRICRNPAFSRDDDGLPCHKTCAEKELEL